MVLILDGNSEVGAQVWRYQFFLSVSGNCLDREQSHFCQKRITEAAQLRPYNFFFFLIKKYPLI